MNLPLLSRFAGGSLVTCLAAGSAPARAPSAPPGALDPALPRAVFGSLECKF